MLLALGEKSLQKRFNLWKIWRQKISLWDQLTFRTSRTDIGSLLLHLYKIFSVCSLIWNVILIINRFQTYRFSFVHCVYIGSCLNIQRVIWIPAIIEGIEDWSCVMQRLGWCRQTRIPTTCLKKESMLFILLFTKWFHELRESGNGCSKKFCSLHVLRIKFFSIEHQSYIHLPTSWVETQE